MKAVLLTLVLALLTTATSQVFDGLVIHNPVYSRTVSLIDTNGQVVNSWNCTTTPAYTVYLMPDSSIWRPDVNPGATMRGGVYGGLMRRYNWDGDIIDSFVWSDSNHQQHHDIHPMKNGNVLVLAWERKTRTQAQAMGRVNVSGEMWPEEIVEYDPVGDSVVWEWHVWDHLIQDVDSTKPNYGVVREHPELLDINLGTLFMYGDWVHANIVEHSEQRDEIVFSSHFLNELYVIDHSTTTEEAAGHTGGRHGKGGDILYRWGNPQNYDRGDSGDQRYFVVHGANWIGPGLLGEGNILVFNNGDRPGSGDDSSSVEELTPPLDSNDRYYIHPDSAFGPDEPCWTYSRPGFYSGHMSGAYRLPNGNTFITEAVSGRLSEVTYDGQVVWQRMTTTWNGRAIKYPRDFASGIARERTGPSLAGRLQYGSPVRRDFTANITYHLSTECRVRLGLFDAAGRHVADLARGQERPGQHTVRFPLPEHSAPGGIYFVQLTAAARGGESCTERAKLVVAD